MGCILRSTIEIDEELIEEAKALTGIKTKKEVVAYSLRELIRKKRREHLVGLFGSKMLDLNPEDIEKIR